MAEIRPFKALQYSQQRVGIEQVVTQPYDKISPEMQSAYRARHPNNLVRILRPASEPEIVSGVSHYQTAGEIFTRWRQEGVIGQVAEPSLFAYFQRFRPAGSEEIRTRKGFIGLVHLEDYASHIVYPHERTLTGPKQDRLELLRHTKTHFGQVFLLYSDPAESVDQMLDRVAAGEPQARVLDEYDVEHLLWRISDKDVIAAISGAMADKKLLIADGHHRYETALRFRDEMRNELGSKDAGAFEWLMTTLVNMESPGLTVLPTHRVVSNLPSFDFQQFLNRAVEYFETAAVGDLDEVETRLREGASRQRLTIGVAAQGAKAHVVLSLRSDLALEGVLPKDVSSVQAQLDVVILHRLVLERCLGISEEEVRGENYLRYIRGTQAAVAEVRSGAAQICFLLNATRIEQVRDVAFRGEVLPQKSTDFFPKLLSGLTMYRME